MKKQFHMNRCTDHDGRKPHHIDAGYNPYPPRTTVQLKGPWHRFYAIGDLERLHSQLESHLQLSRLHGNRNAHGENASESNHCVAAPKLRVTPPPSRRTPHLCGVPRVMRVMRSSTHSFSEFATLISTDRSTPFQANTIVSLSLRHGERVITAEGATQSFGKRAESIPSMSGITIGYTPLHTRVHGFAQ